MNKDSVNPAIRINGNNITMDMRHEPAARDAITRAMANHPIRNAIVSSRRLATNQTQNPRLPKRSSARISLLMKPTVYESDGRVIANDNGVVYWM